MSSPEKVAHFEILKRIGAGGMGEVFLARDVVLDREIALKLIRRDIAGDTEVRHRFLREARLAAAINHSGVATLYEAGETDPTDEGEGQLYLASELVDGKSLERILGDGALALDEVIDLGIQLSEALAAAHDLGIVHRDIKPSNLMVSDDGRLKVLDFGIAKRVGWVDADSDSAATLTYTARGAVVGTPAYMAPEQVAGGSADARTDVHGAGCVLYGMLTGHAPFGGGSPSEVMRRVIVTPPEPLKSHRPEVPRALAEVVEKALAKEPDDRYQSAAELGQALRQAQYATGVRQSIDRLRRGASPRVAAVLVALVVVAAVSVFVGNRLLGRSIAFDERDWLLVADVVNDTGDEGFTLALKSALETDLRQSRHVNIYDEGRARNTLRMMRRDPASAIDLEVGTELCQFAGVRALLVPRIDAVGDVYILQASLVEPATGRTADHIRLTAKGRDEVLLETIDELTRTVRRRLGESLSSIAETDPPLVQYTTSSWEAQRMLALGSHAWAGGRHEEAERCFKLALEEDPEFATARGSLGLLYIQFMGRTEAGKQQLERAFADADEVSRREYLILRAIHSQFVDGNLDSALADYQLVIDLYPDLVQPINNSARILEALGRDEEAERLYLRALEIDPDSAAPLWNLWSMYVLRDRKPVAGERIARELVRIQPNGPWARHALGYALVALRRFDEAEEEMRAVLDLDPTHAYAMTNLAHILFRRGAFSEAESLYRKRWQAWRDLEWKDRSSYDSLRLAATLQNLGEWDEAWVIIEDELSGFRQFAEGRDLDHGEAAFGSCILAALGRTDEAIEEIRRLSVDPDPTADGLYGLARAYALTDDLDRAEEMLVRAMDAGWGDPYFILIDPLLHGLQDRPIIDELAPPSEE